MPLIRRVEPPIRHACDNRDSTIVSVHATLLCQHTSHYSAGEVILVNYFEDVPLSRILTIENKVKQMPPRPANTRAGTK